MYEGNPFNGDTNLTNISTNTFRDPMPSTSAGFQGPPALPPLPPRPAIGNVMNGFSNPAYGSYGMNNYGMGGYGGGLGGGYGGYGGGYGGGYMGGMGGIGGFNRYGNNYGGDLESRFIQMAEENSRPAFQSIESIVGAVGSVAMMLENTFVAMTSSFRAILGVAENFGRLRSLFAQFWSTFAVIRSLNWLIRKLMVILGLRTENEFKAWAEAVAATQNGTATPEQQAKGSSWPILMFFGVVFAAPYIILKLLSGLSSSINEKLSDPTTWQQPLRAIAQYDFQATTPEEISFSANQVIQIAPQVLQGHLWNSGWLMGSVDRQRAGLVPVSYIKVIKPQAPVAPTATDNSHKDSEKKEDLNSYFNE